MRKLLLTVILMFAAVCSFATDKYFKNVSGNNWNTAANWFTDSTFTTTTTVPGSGDNVYLTYASGASVVCNIDAMSNCSDFDCHGFRGTFSGSYTISVYGSVYLSGAMTYSFTSTFFVRGSGARTITTNGKTFGGVGLAVYSTTGGTYTLSDNLTTKGINLYAGTFDLNGKTIVTDWVKLGDGTKTLTCGKADVTVTSSSTYSVDFISNSTGFTFNCDQSTWHITGSQATVNANTITWNNLYFDGSATTTATLYGSNTIDTLKIAIINNARLPFSVNGTTTISGWLYVKGKSHLYRTIIQSSVIGTQITIANNGALSLSECDFKDIAFSGSTAWNSGVYHIGDALGNSGTTMPFDAARTLYWRKSGTTGNWNDTTSVWQNGSGSWEVSPLCQDSVIIDNTSITATGKTITVGAYVVGKGINMSGVTTNNPTINFSVATEIYGNLSFGSSMSITGSNKISIRGRSLSNNLTFNNNTCGSYLVFEGYGGVYTFQDSISSTNLNALYMSAGTVTTNNNKLTVGYIDCSGCVAGTTLNLGSSIVTMRTGTSGSSFNSSNLTLNAGTSTIKMVATLTSNCTFSGGGKTFNNVWFSKATGNTYYWRITGNNTFNCLKFTPEVSGTVSQFRLNDGSVQTMNSLSAIGSAEKLIVITRSGISSNYTFIKKASGCSGNSIDYVNLDYCTASPSSPATWYIGDNSTDGGHNTGWSAGSCLSTAVKLDPLWWGTDF